jgi:hypothetical protein
LLGDAKSSLGDAESSLRDVQVPEAVRLCHGCEGKGTCNADLGRCDCALAEGGPACVHSLAPACVALAARLAPELRASVPTTCPTSRYHTDRYAGSCACLRECWDAGVELVRALTPSVPLE